VTDDTKQDDAQPARQPEGYAVDPRAQQRNLAERLFPGPSREMSEQVARRIQDLLEPLDEEGRAKLREEWRARRKAGERGGHPRRPATGLPKDPAPATLAPAIPVPASVEAPDDSELHGLLDQQNELLRAILASSVDTQTDARATAQNSRTFAWAGTAIALLTLIATVISIIAVVQGG
jgi:hypothetical protein